MLAGKPHPNLRADGSEGRTKQVYAGFPASYFDSVRMPVGDRHGHVSTLIECRFQTDQDAPGIKWTTSWKTLSFIPALPGLRPQARHDCRAESHGCHGEANVKRVGQTI